MNRIGFTRCGRLLASVSAAAALAASPAAAQVRSQPLTALDLWSTSGRDTGLGSDLWRGTAAELARAVTPGLADKPLTPAFAELARRVMATGAQAPDGGGEDRSLAAARVRAILALGDPEAASNLMARTPQVETSEALSRVKAQAALLRGDTRQACETGRALQESRESDWWLRLRAACHAMSDEAAAAQVTMDLWRQQGGRDAAFERLMGRALGGGGDAPKAVLADPLSYSLSRTLDLDLAGSLGEAPWSVLAAIARDSSAPAGVREEAASRALRGGAVPPEAVRSVFTPSRAVGAPSLTDGGAPPIPIDVATASALAGSAGEAALLTIATGSRDHSERQAALSALLGRAKTAFEFQALARLALPSLQSVSRNGAPLSDPMVFASALASAGDGETALAVRSAIEQGGVAGPNAHDLALLDAMIAVAGGGSSGPVLDRLVERGTVGDARARARAQAAAVLLASTGAPMSAFARSQFATFDTPPARTTPARLAVLARAGEEGRKGEAALVALSINLQQPAGPSVGDRALIVSALQRAGLSADARRIALEGLVLLQRPGA